MKAQILRSFIDAHTWVGLVAGFALFIAFYTGAITVFTHELHEWDDYEVWNRPADSLDDVQSLLDSFLAERAVAGGGFSLQLPGEHGPRAVLYEFGRPGEEDRTSREYRWNEDHLQEGEDSSQLASFIYRLHYTAGLPSSWGIYVLGFVCILYGVALLTGVIAYAPGFLRDLFALRVGGNLKRLWQDAHNVIGVLSLPFHVIFAWSGAVLCIGTLLLAPFQFFVFDGKLLSIIGPDLELIEARAPAGIAQPMLSLKELIARAHVALPGLQPETLQFSAAADRNAQVSIYGVMSDASTLTVLGGVALDANTGEILRTMQPGTFSPGVTFFRGLVSLHFGEFGHLTVRWLYFMLGMAGAFLFFSGNLLWIETRRNRRGPQQTRSSRVMAQITLGVALGCIAGVSAAIVASRLLPHLSPQHAEGVELAYYATFFLCLAWAFLRSPARSANELLILCAVMTLAIPLADAWATGLHPLRMVLEHRWIVLTVDLLALLFAFGFLRIARAVRRRSMEGDPNSIWSLSAP